MAFFALVHSNGKIMTCWCKTANSAFGSEWQAGEMTIDTMHISCQMLAVVFILGPGLVTFGAECIGDHILMGMLAMNFMAGDTIDPNYTMAA
jgi:hypothetical protein